MRVADFSAFVNLEGSFLLFAVLTTVTAKSTQCAAFCSLQPFAELNLANNQIVDLTTIGIAALRRLRVIVRL